ncbi:MAG TPA: hypothetical protein VLL54_09655 [Pyrinomonadaceae bacterium]|nr:hypothetical protein [Pyrinomonadaceae bacterium]
MRQIRTRPREASRGHTDTRKRYERETDTTHCRLAFAACRASKKRTAGTIVGVGGVGETVSGAHVVYLGVQLPVASGQFEKKESANSDTGMVSRVPPCTI